ncbi:Transmembrane and coiled-coil domain-containing protein 5B [Microtus ochrogaster]|uniref:Transmembrane and coiled-coil domain-containing protein 5B n=1 Tax=Microtus ochrogaster TaxID=79684 RepID=A0A8J6KNG6_MICOH|nr:Transmembrane and coiled-coil domain-containing protein 5B [Microtus ochrogaster]
MFTYKSGLLEPACPFCFLCSTGTLVLHGITEIPTLEATKQHLNYLNFNLEKDLQRLDQANQLLLRKIQKKEKSIQSLEREIALSTERVPEMDEFNEIAIQKENALKDLELETAKLEEKNKTLSEKIMQLQDRISTELTNPSPDPETLKKKIAELKVKLRKSTKSCAQQEKEIAKMQSDYQSVHELCEDQAHYIKKYQEILREMEKEQEVKLLEKEMSKAQKDSSQKVKPGATLVETIQSNMEKNIIKKEKKKFLVRHFHYLFFMIVVFLRILGCMVFHLQYINPDFLVDTLPMLMSRSTLKWLRDILFPFLTLEVEDVLPH